MEQHTGKKSIETTRRPNDYDKLIPGEISHTAESNYEQLKLNLNWEITEVLEIYNLAPIRTR